MPVDVNKIKSVLDELSLRVLQFHSGVPEQWGNRVRLILNTIAHQQVLIDGLLQEDTGAVSSYTAGMIKTYQGILSVCRSDYATAAIQFEQAGIDHKNDIALTWLAFMHQHALLGRSDLVKAKYCYDFAIDADNSVAMCNKGYLLRANSHDHPVEGNQFTALLKKAVARHNPFAMVTLANRIYRLEESGWQYHPEGQALVRKAAAMGLPFANCILAKQEINQSGNPVELVEAFRVLDAMVEQRCSQAIRVRIALYEQGNDAGISSYQAALLYGLAEAIGEETNLEYGEGYSTETNQFIEGLLDAFWHSLVLKRETPKNVAEYLKAHAGQAVLDRLTQSMPYCPLDVEGRAHQETSNLSFKCDALTKLLVDRDNVLLQTMSAAQVETLREHVASVSEQSAGTFSATPTVKRVWHAGIPAVEDKEEPVNQSEATAGMRR